jgi:hypothetical protein
LNDLFLEVIKNSGLGVAFVASLRAQIPPLFLFSRAAFADGVKHTAEAAARFAAGAIAESV